MKKLTLTLAALALVAPSVAAAGGNRINTPGTEARHEANLAPTKAERTQVRVTETREATAQEPRKVRPRAALAGKVNVAARSRNN